MRPSYNKPPMGQREIQAPPMRSAPAQTQNTTRLPQPPSGETEVVDNVEESVYPEIDNFISALDPDELAYLKEQCDALYPSAGPSKMISETDF